MSLTDRPGALQGLIDVLHAPSQETWERAHDISLDIGRGMSLWQLLVLAEPTFVTARTLDRDGGTVWERIPEASLVAKALRMGLQLQESLSAAQESAQQGCSAPEGPQPWVCAW